jgi:hypothetical protein
LPFYSILLSARPVKICDRIFDAPQPDRVGIPIPPLKGSCEKIVGGSTGEVCWLIVDGCCHEWPIREALDIFLELS